MSLLSVKIPKVKKLSFGEPEIKPPTEEEIIYSKLVAKNPLLEDLVKALDLVSSITGERLRKVITVNRIT